MALRLRTAFLIGVVILILWFLYIERVILAPFVLAAIFAYIFNPVVDFFTHKIKLPRSFSIIIIYLIIVAGLITFGTFLVGQVIKESSQLKNFASQLLSVTEDQINALPSWIKPTVKDALLSFGKLEFFSPSSIFNLFPQAISRIIGFFLFLFSGFYFLKEGRSMVNRLLNFVPNAYRIEIEILLRRINGVLGKYLRGQLIIVFFVSLVLFIALSVLGVKFALILAIFSGFAEIVPMIGPIIAALVVLFVVLIEGGLNFYLTPLQGIVLVVIIYFVTEQIQNYLVAPHIMGKIVKLHPLLILFAVLSGQHLLGMLGIILAVPVAATIRILLEFSLDKINERTRTTRA